MSRPASWLRRTALPLSLVLTIGLAGCAGGDDGEGTAEVVEDADEAVVADPEDDADVAVEDLDDLAVVEGSEEAEEALAEAVTATRDSAVRATFSTNARTGTTTDAILGEGIVGDGDLQVQLDVSGPLAEAYGTFDTEAEVRIVDDVVYLRFPLLLATADVDAAWLSTTLDEVDGGPGDVIGRALLIDPNEAFALLDAPTAVAELDDGERIDGLETTHYLATVELGSVLQTAGIGSDFFAEFERNLDKLIEVHAYVGEDGLVRRMEARMAEGGTEFELVVDVLEVDADTDVVAPDPDDVITFDEFVAANA